MFTHDMTETRGGRVEIADLDFETLQSLVHFVYGKKIDKWDGLALPLIIAADKYNILDLKDVCDHQLVSDLNLENVLEVLIASKTYEFIDAKVQQACKLFIGR
jgi:speckle-type POZ protein